MLYFLVFDILIVDQILYQTITIRISVRDIYSCFFHICQEFFIYLHNPFLVEVLFLECFVNLQFNFLKE